MIAPHWQNPSKSGLATSFAKIRAKAERMSR